MGLANMLHADDLTGENLASSISTSLHQAAPAQMGSSLNTEGASETARILLELIEEKRRE
jgi:predicted glycosyltransferase